LKLPRSVIDKAPSADLFPGQTDETELGFTYADVDRLLVMMIDERYSEEELLHAGFAQDFIEKIARRIVQNQFKRVMPVIAKLSERTINQDFRYLRSWRH
jgi:NAD+ synthase